MTDPSSGGQPRRSRKRLLVWAGLILAVAVFTVGIAALLTNIFERKPPPYPLPAGQK